MEFGDRDVHVWQVDLDDETWDPLFDVLSRDEQAKGRAFAAHELRSRYRRSRTALRMVLARYVQRPAVELRFEYNNAGKPFLEDQGWEFNVSHSGTRALIAIARQAVGVDLEMLNGPGIDPDELAPLVCHPTEKALLSTLPAFERHHKFYKLWTAKEAYCKALGLGLQQTLPTLRFQALPNASIAMVIDEQAGDLPAYFVHALPLMPGFASSLCLPCPAADVSIFPCRGQESVP
jgi:4'-phosphopantetheinyl transferase